MQALSPVEAIEFSPEDTCMAVNESRLNKVESRIHDVAERLARIEGGQSVSEKPQSHGILIAVLSIVGTFVGAALIAYLGWIGVQVVNQGRDIAQIKVLLVPQQIQSAAENPSDPKNIKTAVNTFTTSRQQKREIDQAVVIKAGQKFVAASKDSPDAWKAALASIDYKSFLDSVSYVQQATIVQSNVFATQYDFGPGLPNATTTPLIYYGYGVYPDVPEVHALNAPNLNQGLINGPSYLELSDGHLNLDNLYLKRIIIKNSHVTYYGGPVHLENVVFINCTFEMIRDPGTQEFAKALLSPQSEITFQNA